MTGRAAAEQGAPAARAFGSLFAVAFLATLALALASIPTGLYTAFFTTLTPGVGPASPVLFYFWLGPLPVALPAMPTIALTLVVMTAVYVLLLVVAAARGSSPAKALREGVRGNIDGLLSSDLVIAVASVGFLVSVATAIDSATQAAGGQIGGLIGSDATIFVSAATSPLVEELGFRVCIMGLVALILSLGMGWRGSVAALWRPGSVYDTSTARSGRELVLLVALVTSSVAFGLAHVASGSGWELGKLPEATFGGLVLGYVYMRYGLHIAILTHWGVDYLGNVYSFFGEGAYGIPWGSDPGYVLQHWVTLDLVYGIGLLSCILVAYLGLRRLWLPHPVGEIPSM